MSSILHESFWSEDRRLQLKSVLSTFHKNSRTSPESITRYIIDQFPVEYHLTSTSCRRFVTGKQSNMGRREHLSALLFYSLDQSKPWFTQNNKNNQYKDQIKILTDLKKYYLQTEGLSQPNGKSAALPLPGPEVLQYLKLMLMVYLEINEQQLTDATKNFLSTNEKYLRRTSKDRVENHFVCYRYSSLPGYIAKSFTYIRGANDFLPLSTFKNFLPDLQGGSPRESKGIVLPFSKMTCFIGRIDGSAGAKLMVFDAPSRELKYYQGLVLTMDRDNRPIVSRIIMKRVPLLKDPNLLAHEELKAGIFEETSPEVQDSDIPNLAELLSNSVSSKLRSNFSYGDRPATLTDVVSILENAMLKEGSPKIFDGESIANAHLILQPIGNSALKPKTE